MKLLLLLSTLICTPSIAQDFKGVQVDSYLGATVKPTVKPTVKAGTLKDYKGFYLKFDTLTNKFMKEGDYRPFQKGESTLATSNYDDLNTQEFIVTAINKEDNPYDFSKDRFYAFELSNENMVIYYNYDAKIEGYFELDVLNWNDTQEEQISCNGISTDATPDVTVRESPRAGGMIIRSTERDSINYSISVKVSSTTLVSEPKGIRISLENGESIERPEVMLLTDVNMDADFVYFREIQLTEEEMINLVDNKVKELGLSVVTRTPSTNDASDFQYWCKCIMNH